MNYRFGLDTGIAGFFVISSMGSRPTVPLLYAESEITNQLPDLSVYFSEEKLLGCYLDMIKGSKLELEVQQQTAFPSASTTNGQIARDKTSGDYANRTGLTPANSNGLAVANVTAM